MGLIREGIEGMRDIQFDTLAEEVAYRRADGVELSLTAVPGRTYFHTRGEYGTWVRFEARDFLVRAADMADEPRVGEEFVFNGRVYEVLSINNEPCWRWSDPFRTVRRIHTKMTGGE